MLINFKMMEINMNDIFLYYDFIKWNQFAQPTKYLNII